MSEPFIFIGTHSIKEGKLQTLKQYEQELVALAEANEPRLIAFHIFVNEDGTQATTIQVHTTRGGCTGSAARTRRQP